MSRVMSESRSTAERLEALPIRARSAGLDATRALAVIAMVLGHTFDALLADRYKQTPLFQAYVPFRGMTAPLFLFVSGWAVMTRASRVSWSAAKLARVHLLRALVLFAWACALRWPSWEVSGLWHGDRAVWTHLLGPDALACIAAWVAFSGLIGVLPKVGWVRALFWTVMAGATPYLAAWAYRHPFPLPWGGWWIASFESPFPLVPWGGYFCVGAAVAVCLEALPQKSTRALALLSVGFGLLAVTAWMGLDGLPLWSARLLAYRAGYVCSLGGLMLALTERWPNRWTTWSTPIGRASLVTYVVHLPFIYGWGTLGGLREMWGASLTPWQAGGLALLLVAVGTLISVGLRGQRYASAKTLSESQRPPARNEAM
jgi:uncharacterized membrane protein